MVKSMTRWVLTSAVLTTLMLSGCGQPDRQERVAAAEPPPRVELAEPVEILALHTGSDPGMTQPGVRLIKSRQELEALGAETMGEANIDFQNEAVVLATLGEQPTGGYWIVISDIQRVGDTLYVQGVANRPGPDQVVTQQLTYPFCAAKISSTNATELVPDIQSVEGQPQP